MHARYHDRLHHERAALSRRSLGITSLTSRSSQTSPSGVQTASTISSRRSERGTRIADGQMFPSMSMDPFPTPDPSEIVVVGDSERARSFGRSIRSSREDECPTIVSSYSSESHIVSDEAESVRRPNSRVFEAMRFKLNLPACPNDDFVEIIDGDSDGAGEDDRGMLTSS